MAERNVYAVPVFDKASNSFTGFLGLSDIVHQTVRFFVAKAKLAHPDLAKDVHKLLSASTFNQTDAEISTTRSSTTRSPTSSTCRAPTAGTPSATPPRSRR